MKAVHPFKQGGVMLTKSLIIKIAVLLMLTLLFLSIAFGAVVLADGEGTGQPLPPDKSPSTGGSVDGYTLVISLLTTLQFVL
jgi:hypothetical protein